MPAANTSSHHMDAGTDDRLEYSDPAWVRSVGGGVLLIALSLMGHFAGAIFRWMNELTAKGVFHGASAILLAIGVFMATRGADPKSRAAVVCARCCAWMTMAVWLWLGAIALKFVDAPWSEIKWLVILALGLQAVGSVGVGVHFRYLALRLPDDQLASQSVYGGWLAAAVCMALMVIQFLEITRVASILLCFASPLLVGMTLSLLWIIVVLLRLGINLKIAATSAKTATATRVPASRLDPFS